VGQCARVGPGPAHALALTVNAGILAQNDHFQGRVGVDHNGGLSRERHPAFAEMEPGR